jgi:hypothetical protein
MGFTGERAIDDGAYQPTHVRNHQRRDGVAQDLAQNFPRRVAGMRRATSQAAVNHCAQAPDVRVRTRIAVLGLLGRHVRRCSEHGSRLCLEAVFVVFGDAEVEELHDSLA